MILKVKVEVKGHPSYSRKVKNFDAPRNSSSSKQIIIAVKLYAAKCNIHVKSMNSENLFCLTSTY